MTRKSVAHTSPLSEILKPETIESCVHASSRRSQHDAGCGELMSACRPPKPEGLPEAKGRVRSDHCSL